MTELEMFGKKYTRLVHDNVLNRFEPDEIELLLSDHGSPIDADAYATMNPSQREVLYAALAIAANAHMDTILARTGLGGKSHWCLTSSKYVSENAASPRL